MLMTKCTGVSGKTQDRNGVKRATAPTAYVAIKTSQAIFKDRFIPLSSGNLYLCPMTASNFQPIPTQKTIEVQGPSGPILLGNHLPLTVIAGPCVIEGRQFALDTAFAL